jgi:L-alanine-DL-glutamate epimerase-like enolase superfamily enzyme
MSSTPLASPRLARRDFLKAAAGAIALATHARAQPTSMKIVRAQVHHFQVPLANPVKAAFGVMNTRHLVLLEVTDQDGHSGFGESWTNFPAWGAAERVAAFNDFFLPYLKNKEVADVGSFVLTLAKPLRGGALQSGTMGPLVSTLCAVEAALWDLTAKRRNVSLSKLLFEKPASRVRIYGSGINAPLPLKIIDSYLERGVSIFKLKMGFGDAEDLANLTAMRKHLGGRAKLAIDSNRNWTFAQARSWLDRLADAGVQWLEEPLKIEEVSRTGELAALSKVPISGGENFLVEPGSNIAALAEEPLAIIQPDMAKYCLVQDFLKLLPEAAKRGKRVVPHFLGAAPGQMLAAHLAAGCGADPLVEWDVNENPLHTDFFAEPVEIVDGRLALPDRPGLGWTPKLKEFGATANE